MDFSEKVLKIVDAKGFVLFIVVLILLNSFTLATEHYD